jgi:hypothetical protein
MKSALVGVGSLVSILWILPVGSAETTSSCTTDPEAFARVQWDNSRQGRPIDLARYKRTFSDDFKTLNIVKEDSAPGPGAVWFAPGHGAFRHDCPLRQDGPFQLLEEGLRLRIDKVGKNWKGACMATVNTRGEGFAQQYGYFEAAIRYDYAGAGTGIWGAFWAKSQKDYATTGTTTRTEIDFNEFYGDNGYHATVHLWPAAKPRPGEIILKHLFASGQKHKLAGELFKDLKVDGKVQGFHTYGGEVTPEWVVMYFDRKEVGRFPTMPEWKTPLYLLLDVVMNPREKDKAVFPMDLFVRNVSAYQPVEPYPGQ